MAYDDRRQRLVLVPGGLTRFQTWEWDGSTWRDRTHTPTPPAPSVPWPSPRSWTRLAYDANRGRVVMFGGQWLQQADAFTSETWEWDGETWKDRTKDSSATPPSRGLHAMAFDSARHVVVLFGGQVGPTGVTRARDLWEWDGRAGQWHNRTPSPMPDAWPAARGNAAMVYDVKRSRSVIVGGEYDSAGTMVFANDLWEWDGAAGTWANRTPTPLPDSWITRRAGACAVYDPARAATVLFAGYVLDRRAPADGYVRDVWEWDGTGGSWRDVTPTPLPAAWPAIRWNVGCAFDVARERLYVFGGTSTREGVDRDLWDWSP